MDNLSQPQQQFSGNSQVPLPNATAVLVLGIIGIVGCFCYGFPGLICSIIAMILAKKDLALYNSNTAAYTPGSFSNLKAGKTCAIIGLIMSSLYILFYIVIIAIFGIAFLSHPQDLFNQMR
jgi:hypothetical protein